MTITATKQLAKPGYKHTKLGWIPEDWEFVELDNFLERRKTKYNPKTDEVNHKCIELEHINQDSASINGYCDSINQKSIKSVFENGEVLFGKLRPYLRKYWLSTFDGVCSSEIWVLRGINRKANNNYIGFLVQTHRFIESSNKTSGSKMPRADWDLMSKIPFPLPPLPEQQKIAQILSTWHAGISTLQQLLAAKQQHKKGLMQSLLTGKKRFPGFTEEWKEVRLGDVGEVINGLTYSPADIDDEGILVLRSSNVQNRRLDFKDSVFVRTNKFNPTEEGDILICVRNGSKRLIGKNALITKEIASCAFGAFMTIYRTKMSDFFFQLFGTDIYIKEVHKNLGATINSINGSDLKKFKFLIPPLPEQQKIAAVLSAADAEIQHLTAQLTALQTQKKGLMQKLLSGEVRVRIK